jgi:hypothetical protein
MFLMLTMISVTVNYPLAPPAKRLAVSTNAQQQTISSPEAKNGGLLNLYLYSL